MLPIEASLIHCRWSGESTWIPYGDLRPGIDYENHTSHPAPGQLALYPGGISECEIFFPYGACTTSSKVGQLAANHFATIEPDRLRRSTWAGPIACARSAGAASGRAPRRSRSARSTERRDRGPGAARASISSSAAGRSSRRAARAGRTWRSKAAGSRRIEPDLAGLGGHAREVVDATGLTRPAGHRRRPYPHPRREGRRARSLLPGLGRGGVRRDDDVPGLQQSRARGPRRRPSDPSWPASPSGGRRRARTRPSTTRSASPSAAGWTIRSPSCRRSSTRACRRPRRSWSSTSGSTTSACSRRSRRWAGAAAGSRSIARTQ